MKHVSNYTTNEMNFIFLIFLFTVSLFSSVFFFFQAEDGIRDVAVTGVQTCALPISEPADVNFGGKVMGGAVMKWIDQAGYTCAAGWTGSYCVTVYVGGLHFVGPIRSEERRVGKECRSRWSPYH